MDRRKFLKSSAAAAAMSGAWVAAPSVISPAKAQARAETLLIVSESGPNNLDIHGVAQCAGLRGILELLRPPHQP